MKVDDVIKSMVEYMKAEAETDCGYGQGHINKCAKILERYERSLLKLKNKPDVDRIAKCIKTVVIALNKLNAKTDYSLIETDQREDLGMFIQEKALEAGLPKDDEDIMDEWREW